jgi:hypothetical protein
MAHLMPGAIGVSQAQRGYRQAADLLIKKMVPFHGLFAGCINILGIGQRIFGNGYGQGLTELSPGANIDDPGLRIKMMKGFQKMNLGKDIGLQVKEGIAHGSQMAGMHGDIKDQVFPFDLKIDHGPIPQIGFHHINPILDRVNIKIVGP